MDDVRLMFVQSSLNTFSRLNARTILSVTAKPPSRRMVLILLINSRARPSRSNSSLNIVSNAMVISPEVEAINPSLTILSTATSSGVSE